MPWSQRTWPCCASSKYPYLLIAHEDTWPTCRIVHIVARCTVRALLGLQIMHG